MNQCIVCAKPLTKSGNKYCSNACQGDARARATRDRTLASGIVPEHPTTRKRLLLELLGRKCSICGLTEWMGGPIPLEADHVDGNFMNNALSNLRLVCGNCAMNLPTYKSKNRGNGRHARRERYQAGKSY